MMREKRKVVSIVLVLALVISCLITIPMLPKKASAAATEELGENLFIADTFADYAATNALTLPFTLTDPVTGGLGSLAFDSAGEIKNDGTDTFLELGYSSKAFSSFFAFWDGTDAQSVVGGKLVKGKYKVTAVIREGGSDFATSNWGGSLVGAGAGDYAMILGPTNNISTLTADANGWKTYTFYQDVVNATCDSMSMWFDSGSKPRTETAAQIKSISVQRVIPQLSVSGASDEFDKAAPADLTYTVNLQGNAFEGLSYLGEDLTEGTDYTLTDADGGEKTLVIKKEYLATLSAGVQTLVLSAGGKTADIKIEIIPIQPQIPSKDGYTIETSTVNGDFEAFAEDMKFSSNQAEGAWGSLDSYDYPATIVTKDGSKAMRLQKEATGAKLFSSAFVMLPPELEIGDIVTLKFDYLYLKNNGEPNGVFNIAFVGATNKPNHEINLNGSNPAKTLGENRFKWDISYTALTGDRAAWTQAEVTFVVDTQLKTQCDSLRFLMNVENDNADDVAYFDNVGLAIWKDNTAIDETPVIAAPTKQVFDKKTPADITFKVNTFDYNISSIKRGTANINATAFTIASDNSSFTLKKEYLDTLAVGTHTFTITTLGGTADFTIEIKDAQTGTETGCGCGSIAGFISSGPTMLLGGLALVGCIVYIAARKRTAKKA